MENGDDVKDRLQQTINEASSFSSLKSHPAFGLFMEWLKDQITDEKNKWLSAGPEQAEAIRVKASAFKDVLDYIDRRVSAGRTAERALEHHVQRSRED